MSFRWLSLVVACAVAIGAFCSLPSFRTSAQDAKPATDAFTVPAGNDPAVLEKFLDQVLQAGPAEASKPEVEAYLGKASAAVAELQKKELPDNLLSTTVQVRLEFMFLRTVLEVDKAQAEFDSLVAELSKSEKPIVRETTREVHRELRLLYLPRSTAAQQQKMIDEYDTLLKATKDDNRADLGFAADSLKQVAQSLERINPPMALDAYTRLSSNMSTRGLENAKRVTEMLKPRIERLQLPGKEVNFSTTTLDGKPFELKQLRGKVVVVDFWATWCGPCIQDLPHLRGLYEAYHDKGLEVVGISIDDKKEILTEFMKTQKLPWITLYDNEGPKGFESKLIEQFGIYSTPTTWVIDREGKMVELAAHGPKLDEALAKLLGPLPEPASLPVLEKEAPAAPEVPK